MLDRLEEILRPTPLTPSRERNALVAHHANYSTRIEFVDCDQGASTTESEIRCVIRLVTGIPSPIDEIFWEADGREAYNRFASLGALYARNNKVYLGSRLTIYERETPDVWLDLQLPIIAFTAILGNRAIIGTLERHLDGRASERGTSGWNQEEMSQVVEKLLSMACVCTGGGLGLTAEFGLREGQVSAISGDRDTALFQMSGEDSHPELGGGLFCLLQMPHQFDSLDKLNSICSQLNRREMSAMDMPPHFGAWCAGRLGNNPAYVSFFPNSFHSIPGIAFNCALWSKRRAEWASGELRRLML